MDKKKLDTFQEFLDFVQQDFDKVDERNKESLTIKGLEYGLTEISWMESVGKSKFPQKETWDLLVCTTKDALSVLRHVVKFIRKSAFFYYDKPMVFLSTLVEDDVLYQLPHDTIMSGIAEYEIITVLDVNEKAPVLKTSVLPHKIFDQLDGVPRSRLKTCPECETIFVQKTAREKKYCSDFCKNKHHLKLKKA